MHVLNQLDELIGKMVVFSIRKILCFVLRLPISNFSHEVIMFKNVSEILNEYLYVFWQHTYSFESWALCEQPMNWSSSLYLYLLNKR